MHGSYCTMLNNHAGRARSSWSSSGPGKLLAFCESGPGKLLAYCERRRWHDGAMQKQPNIILNAFRVFEARKSFKPFCNRCFRSQQTGPGPQGQRHGRDISQHKKKPYNLCFHFLTTLISCRVWNASPPIGPGLGFMVAVGAMHNFGGRGSSMCCPTESPSDEQRAKYIH
jgi:hypothetical protein